VRGAPPDPVAASVSIVIPTRDAGPAFHRVLASVLAQQGLAGLELVVADSDSRDGTPELAREAGATVLSVPPSEFGHGRTRNLAAEAAAGDVLLMLVQDAVILGSESIHTLVNELTSDDGLAAVSARQVPRSDADLLGTFLVYAHDRALDAAAPGGRATPAGRRAAVAVDNVCAAIRREAWKELRFSDVAFAEDLDFGLRAVERGWAVRRSRAAAVAHSHDRDAVYHFRRSARDRLDVAPLVGDDRLARAADVEPLALLAAAEELLAQVQAASSSLAAEAPLGEHLHTLHSRLGRAPGREIPRDELALLAGALGSPTAGAASGARLLRDDLLTLLTWPTLTSWARAHAAVSREDASVFAARLTGLALGRSVGDSLRRHGSRGVGKLLGQL
jgi:O-antigen biosynthesis protein